MVSNDTGSSFAISNCTGCTGQCVRNIGPKASPIGFALVGNVGSGNTTTGVAVSLDDGRSFEKIDITALNTYARYGAFPSADTWYISAGQWGNEQSYDAEADAYWLTERMSVGLTEAGEYVRSFKSAQQHKLRDDTGYMAQIVKTTDAGKTWTMQFNQSNTFYFNGIDCINESSCCAVGESDDAPAAGTYIYCTFDGTNWEQMFTNLNSTGASLMDIRTVGATGYWAVG
jgi:hypothetical protein